MTGSCEGVTRIMLRIYLAQPTDAETAASERSARVLTRTGPEVRG